MKKKSLINSSGEVRELTRKEIRAMQTASAILPTKLVDVLPRRKRGQRGLQKHPKKISVTLRYSSEVVDYFKATGKGWQVLMDDVLKKWIKKHPQRSA